jgi:alpha-glucosidase
MTLPGMPFIYYGDELGMEDVPVPKEKVKDPFAAPDGKGRDVVRTPMIWDSGKHAGFSDAEPWLPVGPNYRKMSVAAQQDDEQSFLNLYRVLLRIRNNVQTIKYGAYWSLDLGDNLFGFVRENDMERYLVVLNFSDQEKVAVSKAIRGAVRLSTYMDKGHYARVYGGVKLRPYEGVIIEAV